MKIILLIFLFVYLGSYRRRDKKERLRAHFRNGIASGRVVGLDVRTKGEYTLNKSHGAKNITVRQLCEQFYEFDFDQTILVFCEAGGRASLAKACLRKRGFERVINIGDWRAWNRIMEGA